MIIIRRYILNNNDTLNRIEELMQERDWTLYRLAKEADIPYGNLNNLFKRNNEPSISTLRKICNGFNISISDFFSDNIHKPTNDYSLDEKTVILEYRSLSRSDKELVKAYIMGLKRQKIQ